MTRIVVVGDLMTDTVARAALPLAKGSDTPAAVGYCRAALAVRPDAAVAHYKLGRCLGSLGHLDDAIHHYRRVVELNPADAWGHMSLGAALADQGRLSEAAACYQQAIGLNPGSRVHVRRS